MPVPVAQGVVPIKSVVPNRRDLHHTVRIELYPAHGEPEVHLRENIELGGRGRILVALQVLKRIEVYLVRSVLFSAAVGPSGVCPRAFKEVNGLRAWLGEKTDRIQGLLDGIS